MKSSGETLLEAWIPLQPALIASKPSNGATRMRFQFLFTARTIETVAALAITNSNGWFMLLRTMRIVLRCALAAFVPCSFAADSRFAERAERAFHEARALAGHETTNIVALVQLARAAFDWAELARTDNQREEVATRGIDAARAAARLQDTNASAHYWLAMNLGQLARTRTLGALKLVREMEAEFLRARALDPRVDYAGPDRSLGFLYRDTPGWPTSIGSKRKARMHFEAAVRHHPEFPDNQLGLAESLLEWDEMESFRAQLGVTEGVLTRARDRFKGAAWDQSWADWTKRMTTLRAKADNR
jgi:hypothetical protein